MLAFGMIEIVYVRENLTGGMSLSVFLGIATSSCVILYHSWPASVLRTATLR